MGRLLGVAFAILIAVEIALLVIVTGLMAMLVELLWNRSPFMACTLVLILILAAVAFWRSRRNEAASAAGVHSGISVSRIPITGAAGAIYMLQFLVWAVLEPAVGLFYAALIAGAVLLLPVAFYVNRRRVGGAGSAGAGGLLGLLCGLAFFGLASSREIPLAKLFPIALAAGVVGAGVLVWSRSKGKHTPSIAPYGE